MVLSQQKAERAAVTNLHKGVRLVELLTGASFAELNGLEKLGTSIYLLNFRIE